MASEVLHLDMDAFFASVEVRANPRLCGRPLLVGGGPPGRAVVTTASYPARVFGIRSGMSMVEARSRCPQAVFLPVDPPKYIAASAALLDICCRFSPVVEPASIDEFFLELSGSGLRPEACLDLACALKNAIRKEQKLTCSIGLAPNKLQAKMASSLSKPDGLTQIGPGEFEKIFWHRPAEALWGVGPETAGFLARMGIMTIGDLAHADDKVLERIMGIGGRVLIRMARGQGGGPVVPFQTAGQARSMGHETTLVRDESDPGLLERHLLLLSDKLARRLRREEHAGHVIALKLKWSDRTFITRQKALAFPTDEEQVIYAQAVRLLRQHHRGRPVRLIGVNVGHLVSRRTLYPLLEEDRKRRRLNLAKDRIRNRFGERILMPAGVLTLTR